MVYEYNGITFSLQKEGNSDRATTQMNFEDIMLREISQLTKDKYFTIPFIWGTQGSQIQIQKTEC